MNEDVTKNERVGDETAQKRTESFQGVFFGSGHCSDAKENNTLGL